jgi:undecaprenyl pyrophosphate synthase
MTNRDLLTRIKTSLAVLANGTTEESEVDFGGAQTTTVRYAVKKNRDRLQKHLKIFYELIDEDAEEAGAEPKEAREAARALAEGKDVGLEDSLQQKIEEALSEDTPFEPYRVPEEAIMQETGVPIAVLDLIDWMIESDA